MQLVADREPRPAQEQLVFTLQGEIERHRADPAVVARQACRDDPVLRADRGNAEVALLRELPLVLLEREIQLGTTAVEDPDLELHRLAEARHVLGRHVDDDIHRQRPLPVTFKAADINALGVSDRRQDQQGRESESDTNIRRFHCHTPRDPKTVPC